MKNLIYSGIEWRAKSLIDLSKEENVKRFSKICLNYSKKTMIFKMFFIIVNFYVNNFNMRIIGIDPGLSGAIAILDDNKNF